MTDDWRTRAKPATYPASQANLGIRVFANTTPASPSAHLNTQPAPKLRAKRKLPAQIQANAAKSANGTGGAEDLTTARTGALNGTPEVGKISPVIWFTLPWPQLVNARTRVGKRGQVYTTAADKAWFRRCRGLLKSLGLKPIKGPVELEIWNYRPNNRSDWDSPIKAISDVLEGYAYENDKQVEDGHVHKRLDRDSPRVVVKVWRIEVEP